MPQKPLPFILLALIMMNCGAPPTPNEITFSHILSDRSEWHYGAARWKELAYEKLGGAPALRIITNSSLSGNNQRTELEMVQAGTLGGSWESSILLSIADPKWTVWSMPWLFDSYEEAERICVGELGQEMLKSLESKGIVGLAYGFNGFRHLTNSKRAVVAPGDLKGLKIRIPALQMYISLFKHWSADPSQMNFGDLIVALREGAMDGQENPLHVIRSSGVYELQGHLTRWEYSFDPLIFCMSKRVWDRMPAETQAILRDAAIQSCAEQRALVVESEKDHLAFLQEKGVKVSTLSPAAIQEFQALSQPIYDEYRSVIGAKLLDRFLGAAQP